MAPKDAIIETYGSRTMTTDQTVLTDDMWERIEPLLSGTATDPGRTADNRLFLEAVLWRLRTGSP